MAFGRHRGESEKVTTPIDPRDWDQLSPEEQAKSIEKAVDFDTQDTRIRRGTTSTPPAV